MFLNSTVRQNSVFFFVFFFVGFVEPEPHFNSFGHFTRVSVTLSFPAIILEEENMTTLLQTALKNMSSGAEEKSMGLLGLLTTGLRLWQTALE